MCPWVKSATECAADVGFGTAKSDARYGMRRVALTSSVSSRYAAGRCNSLTPLLVLSAEQPRCRAVLQVRAVASFWQYAVQTGVFHDAKTVRFWHQSNIARVFITEATSSALSGASAALLCGGTSNVMPCNSSRSTCRSVSARIVVCAALSNRSRIA